MLYNFPFLHQNVIKVISIESWGHKDYIKLIPVLGNSLYLVSLAVRNVVAVCEGEDVESARARLGQLMRVGFFIIGVI